MRLHSLQQNEFGGRPLSYYDFSFLHLLFDCGVVKYYMILIAHNQGHTQQDFVGGQKMRKKIMNTQGFWGVVPGKKKLGFLLKKKKETK